MIKSHSYNPFKNKNIDPYINLIKTINKIV